MICQGYKLTLIAFVLFISVLGTTAKVTDRARVQTSSPTTPPIRTLENCDERLDMQVAVEHLSSLESGVAAEEIGRLFAYSGKSDKCRDEIVGALTSAMIAANPYHMSGDQTWFPLWTTGSRMLGHLKTPEGLDFLISHLDVDSGWASASMSGQPALIGVHMYGKRALPKLKIAVQENPNKSIRIGAAFLLYSIGEPEAFDAIRLALETESDPCIAEYMRLALEMSKRLRKTDNPNATASKVHEEALAKFNLLQHYYCDPR